MHQLNLFLLRTLYGKYSYSYHQALQSAKQLKRKKFKRSCSRTDPLSHYRKVKENRKAVTNYKCNEKLHFGNSEFGDSFGSVRRTKKSFQCYDIERYDGIYWKRIGFKERIFSTGVKRIFHFLNDEFFFGELSFSDIRKVDDKKIASALIEKYTGKSGEGPDGDYRIDFKDGFIYVENSGINLSIKYISEQNPETTGKLIKILEAQSCDKA